MPPVGGLQSLDHELVNLGLFGHLALVEGVEGVEEAEEAQVNTACFSSTYQ